jgi:hypothetical protein
MNPKYKTEKEYLDAVESFLIECNFKTWREVIPDEEKSKSMPLRVDLIFYRRDIGYVGAEGKNFRSLRSGGEVAKSLLQLRKYSNLHYFGSKINKWCIASPVNIPSIEAKDIEERVLFELSFFIKHFINFLFDFSVLEFCEYQDKDKNRIIIDSGITDRVIRITKQEVSGGGLLKLK